MCTVTIIPTGNQNFVLTSNRDEAPERVAITPNIYDVNGVNLLFPKDKLSGGTWIGVSDKKRLICVLNGGFGIHKRKASYRKSRGIVAKDLMLADAISSEIKNYDFSDIEPFTIIIADWNFSLKFYELVWDGEQSHFSELPLEPKIWSSSTLYSEAMKNERQDWFKTFQSGNELNSTNMLKFHKHSHKENKDYGLVMDRGFVKTTSITQVEKLENMVSMRFESMGNQQVFIEKLNFKETIVNG
ncbi:NRDE family protein [Tamlana agarivorans]|uniref:NRDE family protein n=1 Tax=Pseudotamlana agarivorans TaxID=481183 RepID=A0ACC5UAE2_9FLAO|nr:NRDE family protein [Tamlana agarivorans]MBU2951297.1 NRDE family protein [Tamlana agarivorans]